MFTPERPDRTEKVPGAVNKLPFGGVFARMSAMKQLLLLLLPGLALPVFAGERAQISVPLSCSTPNPGDMKAYYRNSLLRI